MIAAIMQPTYLPWLGYFDLIDRVDVFVFYDNIQISKQSWGTRNKIKTPQGELWLSVPLIKRKKHVKESLFMNTEVNYAQPWFRKHLKSVEHNYKKTPYFNDIYPIYEKILNENLNTLADLNIKLIENFCHLLKIKTPIKKSSTLNIENCKKDERLVKYCAQLGANEYLSPQGAKDYINEFKIGGAFCDSPVALYYHNFEYPIYSQTKGNFMSHLCILDVLFNVGPEKTSCLIQKGRKEKICYKNI